MYEDTPRQESVLDGSLAVLGLATFLFVFGDLMSTTVMPLSFALVAPAVLSLWGAFSQSHHRGLMALGSAGMLCLIASVGAGLGVEAWRTVGALVLAVMHLGLWFVLHHEAATRLYARVQTYLHTHEGRHWHW